MIKEETLLKLFGHQEWVDLLSPILQSDEFEELGRNIMSMYKSRKTIYPEKDDIFKMFKLLRPQDIKVFVVGQDPYHDGCARGYAFGVDEDKGKIPPSLRNIAKEVESDCYDGMQLDFDYNLEKWYTQGVFLYNTALTVEKGLAGSHSAFWAWFTSNFLTIFSSEYKEVVYLLWGKHAQKYKEANYIKEDANYFLETSHPSPFSYTAGFKGSKHFSKTNDILTFLDKKNIIW